jgi:HlyD family secretion protein
MRWLAGTLMLLWLAAPATGHAQARAERPPDRIAVAAPGLVEPAGEERNIGSEVIGTIRRMLVEENDEVSAGQVIAEIDNAEAAARLAGARADVALRRAELERLVAGARREERDEAHAALAEAESQVEMARLTLERRRPLAGTGAVSQAALDDARTTLDSATARRNVLRARVALIEAPPRHEDVAAAQARLALAEANAALAQALYDKTLVRSPIAGVVLRRWRTEGEAVSNQPPTPIAIIGDMRTLRVRAEVDETDIARIAPGQPVLIRADAYEGQRFTGRIMRIAERLGAKQVRTGRATDRADVRVLEVLIALDPDVRLPAGLRVDVLFLAPPGAR